MPPADPSQPASERDPYEADEAEEAEAAADASDLASLRKRGDVPGMLALAKAYRSGTVPGGRDLKLCLEAYRVAAELGSAEAEYAVALFHMNGGTVVAQDLKEGTMHLRSAAEKGSVPAKVYLGNLYELGIHYKADAEKADVWYRNAGRGARVDAEQGSEEWNRALADLGCARHVLSLVNDPATSEDVKTRLLARAKAHGHGLRIREDTDSGDRATFVDALAAGSERIPPTATPPPVAVDIPGRGDPLRNQKDTSPETLKAKLKVDERAKPAPEKASEKALEKAPLDPAAKAAAEKAEKAAKKKAAEARARRAAALGAFGYALLFMLAGTAAGYAATLGARELVSHGHVLPLIGTKTRLVFPIVLGLIGVLPAWLVYRFGAVMKAMVLGAALGGIGWVAWGTGRGAFHADRPLQALAFAAGGFLAGLLVLGLLGGAKPPRPTK
jgi:hypothetical protein